MVDFKVNDQVRKMNEILGSYEFQDEISNSPAPIFIIGLPRSGTTIFFQLLVDWFMVSYPDNLTSKFWSNPVFGFNISNELSPYSSRYVGERNSSTGFTSNVFGTSEFGYYWKRFFNYTNAHQQTQKELTQINWKKIEKEIYFIEKSIKLPVVFKNPAAITPNVLGLVKNLKSAKFVFIKRDLSYVAQSIYKERLKTKKTNNWLFTRPIFWQDQLLQSPQKQIIWQINKLNEIIEQAQKELENQGRKFEIIQYEDFCAFPQKSRYNLSNSFNLELKNPEKKPLPLNLKNRLEIDENVFLEFKNHLTESN